MAHSLTQIGSDGAPKGGVAAAGERAAHGAVVSLGVRAAPASMEAMLAQVRPQFAGAYVHVPFCFHKCHYCDFYSFVDKDDRQAVYVERLEAELAAGAVFVAGAGGAQTRGAQTRGADDRSARPLSTIFVGGGTPTLLAPPLLRRAMRAIRERLPLAPDVEWTVEANPETVTDDVAQALVQEGVNRVSIGAQSFQPEHLKSLERWHDPASVGRAVACMRRNGIARINIDLIFGIPGSTLQDWCADLDAALALGPTHVSCYGLTYEPNTAMTHRLARGEFARCPEDVEAAMYEATVARLAAAGFAQYEISNWCLPGEECRHNMLYWRNQDWLAFGPSASGHAQGVRWKNVPRLGDWLASGPWSPVVDVEQVDADARVGERLMMGLRLREGVAVRELHDMLATGSRGAERRRVIDGAMSEGLLEEWARPSGGERAVRFTAKGQLLADSVLCKLI